jgi:hypothetical protein
MDKERMIQEIIELQASIVQEYVVHNDDDQLEYYLRDLSGIDSLTEEEIWEQWVVFFPDTCPECGSLFIVHNDDGSCVED